MRIRGIRKMVRANPELTLFQKRVLLAALDVPKGRTVSYKYIAARIGTKAYRAVGQALKKNPYAPHVPCHRVIRSDGTIGGYSGGLRRKKELLRKERSL